MFSISLIIYLQFNYIFLDKAMIDEASNILLKYLTLEKDKLTSWMAGEATLTKEELKHSVTVILNLIQGVGSQLPFWQAPTIQHQHSKVKIDFFNKDI